MVGLQGATCRDQVHNGIGKTCQRGQLHAAVQLDHIHVHALFGKEVLGNVDVFGGHFQSRTLPDHGFVIKVRSGGHTHAAGGDFQVQGLVQASPTMLNQGVQSRDPEIGSSILHIGGHIGGSDQDHPHMRLAGGQDEFSGGLGIFQDLDPGLRQKRHGFIKNASLGQR